METHLWHVESELLGEVVHHLVCAEDGGRQVEGGLVLRVGRVARRAVPPAPLVAEREEEEEGVFETFSGRKWVWVGLSVPPNILQNIFKSAWPALPNTE